MDVRASLDPGQSLRGSAPRYRGDGYYDYRYERERRERLERRKKAQQPPPPPADPCEYIDRAFMSCVGAHSANVGACQFYYEALDECRRRTTPVDPCAYDLKTFTACVGDHSDRLHMCQFYFDILQDCRQRHDAMPKTQ